MTRKLILQGSFVFRGNSKISSCKFKALLRGDKAKNGRDKHVYTSLALIKNRAGIVGSCPFLGKTAFVNEAFLSIQTYLTKKASTALFEVLDDSLTRFKCAHKDRWGDNVHLTFTNIAFALANSTSPSLTNVVIQADDRLNNIKPLLHRFSLYSTAYPKAAWQDSILFAVGSKVGRSLLAGVIPGPMKSSKDPHLFFHCAFLMICSGLNSGFFIHAATLCAERKKQMLAVVETHENLCEQLFTKISDQDGTKDRCISQLGDAIKKQSDEISQLKNMMHEKDLTITELRKKVERFENASSESRSTLDNDTKRTLTNDETEEGELTDDSSVSTLDLLPPLPPKAPSSQPPYVARHTADFHPIQSKCVQTSDANSACSPGVGGMMPHPYGAFPAQIPMDTMPYQQSMMAGARTMPMTGVMPGATPGAYQTPEGQHYHRHHSQQHHHQQQQYPPTYYRFSPQGYSHQNQYYNNFNRRYKPY